MEWGGNVCASIAARRSLFGTLRTWRAWCRGIALDPSADTDADAGTCGLDPPFSNKTWRMPVVPEKAPETIGNCGGGANFEVGCPGQVTHDARLANGTDIVQLDRGNTLVTVTL